MMIRRTHIAPRFSSQPSQPTCRPRTKPLAFKSDPSAVAQFVAEHTSKINPLSTRIVKELAEQGVEIHWQAIVPYLAAASKVHFFFAVAIHDSDLTSLGITTSHADQKTLRGVLLNELHKIFLKNLPEKLISDLKTAGYTLSTHYYVPMLVRRDTKAAHVKFALVLYQFAIGTPASQREAEEAIQATGDFYIQENKPFG